MTTTALPIPGASPAYVAIATHVAAVADKVADLDAAAIARLVENATWHTADERMAFNRMRDAITVAHAAGALPLDAAQWCHAVAEEYDARTLPERITWCQTAAQCLGLTS